MADIIYTYQNQVYANITNTCNCRCTFCIRNHGDSVGEAETLWHKTVPTLEEIKAAMDAFDFAGYNELVYCGYGEPTCALESLIQSAQYAKQKYNLSIRLNTNGLGNLYNKKNIIPLLSGVIDTISISLNAPTKEAYMEVTRPQYQDAFESLLDFTMKCRQAIPNTKLTIVDVLPQEDIEASRSLAFKLGVPLRIRHYT